jgi:hypothetical protein
MSTNECQSGSLADDVCPVATCKCLTNELSQRASNIRVFPGLMIGVNFGTLCPKSVQRSNAEL